MTGWPIFAFLGGRSIYPSVEEIEAVPEGKRVLRSIRRLVYDGNQRAAFVYVFPKLIEYYGDKYDGQSINREDLSEKTINRIEVLAKEIRQLHSKYSSKTINYFLDDLLEYGMYALAATSYFVANREDREAISALSETNLFPDGEKGLETGALVGMLLEKAGAAHGLKKIIENSVTNGRGFTENREPIKVRGS